MKKTIKLFIFATLFISFTSLKPMYFSEETNTSYIYIPQRQTPNSYLDTGIMSDMEEEKETLYINYLQANKIFEQLIEQSLIDQPIRTFITINKINDIDNDINDPINEYKLAIKIIYYINNNDYYINNLINYTSFLDNLDIIYSISNLAEKYNLDKNKLAQEIINSIWLKIDNKSTENLLFKIITEYYVYITNEFIENHAYNDYYELSDDFYNLIISRRNLSRRNI